MLCQLSILGSCATGSASANPDGVSTCEALAEPVARQLSTLSESNQLWIARHLTDPANRVYTDMEGSIWEANVRPVASHGKQIADFCS